MALFPFSKPTPLVSGLLWSLLLLTHGPTQAEMLIPQPSRGFSRASSLQSRPNAVLSHRRLPSRTWNPGHGSRSSMSMAFVETAAGVSLIGSFFENFPYLSAFVTCAVKGSAADYVAQKSQPERKPPSFRRTFARARGGALAKYDSINLKRNLAFILYGGFYQGMAQEYIYNNLFPLWFGHGSDMYTTAKKVIFAMGVKDPMLTLPMAYVTKALIFRSPLKDSLKTYVTDVREKGLLLKFWALWTPVLCFTFSMVPEHLRVSFIALVSFFWLVLLSKIC